MVEGAEAKKLTSWKEIADFLSVSVRTAQNYENVSGLPVHRLPGEKGRVWAYAHELAQWSAPVATAISAVRETEPSDPSRAGASVSAALVLNQTATRPPKSRWVVAVGALAIVVVWGVGLASLRPARIMTRFALEANVLRMFDGENRAMWAYALPTIPAPASMPEGNPSMPQTGLIADIDGDHRPEFLFIYRLHQASGDTTRLYCFGADGKVRWSFIAGHAVETVRNRAIDGLYSTKNIAVLSKPRSDGGRIVINSTHAWSWTDQVAVLTKDGKLVAEYWHPGWLFSMTLGQLTNDGSQQIILGGVNNSLGEQGYGSTMVILDADFPTGQGHAAAGDGRQINGMPPAAEAAVLLFPDFVPSPNPDYYCRIETVRQAGSLLEVHAAHDRGEPDAPYVVYQLDLHLAVVGITPSNKLAQKIAGDTIGEKQQARIWAQLSRTRSLRNRFAER